MSTPEKGPYDNQRKEAGMGNPPLVCPECHTSFQGVESATCSVGHKPILLDWWPICECGDHTHYDMTTFCLHESCDCEEYRESAILRQVSRRTI